MLTKRTDVVTAVRPAQGAKPMMLALLFAVGGMMTLSAWAQAPETRDVPRGAAHHKHRGHPGAHGLPGGPGFFMGSPERIDRSVDRMLKGLDATDAQRSQIRQIARSAAADLRTQREASRALREQGLQLFAAPVVDARAVEAHRQQRLAQQDQVSRRISQAMLEVSAVLSPEQRGKLVARVKEREQRMKARLQERGERGLHHGPRRGLDRQGAASAPAR